MPTARQESESRSWIRRTLVAVGIVAVFGLLVLGDLDPERPAVTRTAAVALLMAVLWITEAIPLAVTSLLPVALLPVLGVLPTEEVAAQYFNSTIFLFVGGFMVALAMERWQLHRRMALRILLFFGDHPRRILLGFMVATAFLSMWISNTAATMMMVTIALAIIGKVEASTPDAPNSPALRRFTVGLLLAVAYSATIGGTATLVGTPPNLSLARIFEIYFPAGPEISFAQWFLFSFPAAFVFLGLVWLYFARYHMPRREDLALDHGLIREEYEGLGPLSFAERVVLVDFVILVALWMTRAPVVLGDLTIPGWSSLLPESKFVKDGTVAVLMASILFMVPSGRERGERVMNWETAVRLPWGIILLFGGGFALAYAFKESGLAGWVGGNLEGASAWSPWLLVAVIGLTMTFLTELTSNTATTEMILPILAGISQSAEINPLLLMIPVTLSCSCAFMMPVATPPNAIVFGSERLKIADMVKAGLMLNFLGAGLILLSIWLLGGLVWGIDVNVFPDWAR